MGKFRACVVTLRQGQEVFRQGERVGGVVMLEVTEAVVVRGVRVYCYGESLTKWTNDLYTRWSSEKISTETYFAQAYYLFGKRPKEEGPNHTLTVGRHRWNFTFRLPLDTLPSSIEGEYGAVRWLLMVEVDKPFPSINNKWYRPFTVLSLININDAVYQPSMKKAVSKTVSKALGIGNAGILTLNAQTDHFGYCPGEIIFVTVEAKNDSSKDMGKVSITLIQNVKFTANDETKTNTVDLISTITERTLAKGTTMRLIDIQLRVPAVPPSTRKRTCHHILCTYTVKVCLHVPWGLKLEADIPVSIGTVPRGYSLPRPQQARSQGTAAAAAAATAAGMERPIPYKRCEAGTTPCTKSHNTFANLRFTPLTVFIPFTQATPLPSAHPTPTPTPNPIPAPSAFPQEAKMAGMTYAAATVKENEAFGAFGGELPNLTAYTPPSAPLPPSAPPAEDMPPSYEDIMKMEERETASAQNVAAMTVPEGRKCVTLFVRFPDSSLAAFRQAIQREQNNLLDNGEAFLAALCPQPLSTLEAVKEYWPDHYSLALMVFPDQESGEGWVKGVEERGDSWYPDCHILMSPASWSVPSDVSDRLLFSIVVGKLKEGVAKRQFTAFSKHVLPLFVKLRQKHGGIRQSVSNKTRVLHGNWASDEHSISVIWWPRARNYLSYTLELQGEDYAKFQEETNSMFETQSTLLISEDVTSLSTQPTTSPDDDVTAGDDDLNDDEENAEEESTRLENLLDSQSQWMASDFD